MPQPKRVFFSYPHSDRAFATRLSKSVAKQGLELDGIDPSMPAARNGIEQLEGQILSTDAVLLVINPRSKFDETQQRIWQAVLGAAWANPKLRILPVLLRDAELPPFVLSAASGNDVQAIRIQNPSDLGQATRAILESLGLVKPSSSVVFEIYPSSPEAARNERLERLAELREYVEQLKH